MPHVELGCWFTSPPGGVWRHDCQRGDLEILGAPLEARRRARMSASLWGSVSDGTEGQSDRWQGGTWGMGARMCTLVSRELQREHAKECNQAEPLSPKFPPS